MSMDICRLCRVFRFLEQLLKPFHTASLYGLFYAVAYKDLEVFFFVKSAYWLTAENQCLRISSKDQEDIQKKCSMES